MINMKNTSDPLYLSAREAAAELSVSPATLYAYVSRGLVRSEATADSRARRYRADDVRALKNRRAPAGSPKSGDGDRTAVLDSAISTLTAHGPLYRGVLAVRLADHATLEETATLLWDVDEADPFSADNLPSPSATLEAVRQSTLPFSPLARTIALMSVAGEEDPRAFNRSIAGRTQTGARVMRLTAGAILGASPSGLPIHRQLADAWAPGNRVAEDLIRRALVLLAEHELNASAYTVRCAVSTGLNLYDATVAGLAAVKGPRHGGAGPLAARLIDALASGDLAAGIRERVALGERFPGFGHAVYPGGDPRADHLLSALSKAGADPRLAVEAPRLIREATGLHPTIDYAIAVMTRMLGLPVGHELAIFALARTAGWIAHAMEQQDADVLIRPRARYTGPAPARMQPTEAI
jgi:citrate synthase